MAKGPSYSLEGLAALGAPALARLVHSEAERDANFKRLVKAALAAAKGPDAVAKLVDRRLASLEKAQGRIGWRRERLFREDLDASLRAIVQELGALSPEMAGERLLRFLGLGETVLDRAEDTSGRIRAVFAQGAAALAALAARMDEGARDHLAASLARALADDGEGVLREAAFALGAALDAPGRARFDGALGEAGSDDLLLRQHLARLDGDVDRFAALETEKPAALRDAPALAAWFLQLGRAADALAALDGSPPLPARATRHALARADALQALGRREEAQDIRWARFAAALDAEALRLFLGALGDFEEFDALDRAFALAAAFPDAESALAFLVAWPNLREAARLVVARRESWTGRLDAATLEDAAERLGAAEPLAAILLLRVRVETILARGWSDGYPLALAHLRRIEEFGAALEDDAFAAAALPTQAAWRSALERRHPRRAPFWNGAAREGL